MHAEDELEPVAELNRPAAQEIGAAIALELQYAPDMHSLHALSFVEPILGLKLGEKSTCKRVKACDARNTERSIV